MTEKIFVRIVHWVTLVDELGIGVPAIDTLTLRGGHVARVNGARAARWARAILRNSTAEETVFEAMIDEGRRVRIDGSPRSRQFQVRFESGGRESRFVALASVSRLLARSAFA